MLIACWSVKGGSGTTVVATTLSLLLARSSPGGALLVDLGGDAPAALGVPDPTGPGVADWLANPAAGLDALDRLAVDAVPGLRLLARGSAPLPPAGGERLAAALAGAGPTVVDCGLVGDAAAGVGVGVAGAATASLLVIRPCYLALRRALAAPLRPSGVIVVAEDKRSLNATDVGEVLGVPVRAVIGWDPAVARAVDAGLLGGRVPRTLSAALRGAA